MRTTLEIDDDVLLAAKELAARQGISMGRALSDLARAALTPKHAAKRRHGIPLFPSQAKAGVITLDLVNRLRDESP